MNFGGVFIPPFFSALSILARLNGLLTAKLARLARQTQNMSQARVTRLNDQLGFTRTCIKTPCNYVFINLILNPVSFDDEKR